MQAWRSQDLPRLEPDPGLGPVCVFDTLTGDVRPVGPDEGTARLYVCGITPYDATHMGHAATYVAFDLLNRAWRDAGQTVTYVQNVTDVDDPLLERAEATGVDWRELARDQTDLFRADMTALNVVAPEHYVGATEVVDRIVPAVEQLLERGLAYRVPGAPDAHGAGGLDVAPPVTPACRAFRTLRACRRRRRVPPGHAQHLGAQRHPVPQRARQTLRELVRAAQDPGFLGAADRDHHAVQTPAGAQVEKHVQRGVLVGLGRENRCEHGFREGAGAVVGAVLPQPLGRRDAVQRGGVRAAPGLDEVQPGGRGVDQTQHL